MSSTPMPLVLWGAAGHARVLQECVTPNFRVVALFDNAPTATSPLPGVPLYIGDAGFATWRALHPETCHFLVAIGGAGGAARLQIHERLVAAGLEPARAHHRSAFIAPDVVRGAGSQVLAQAAVCVAVRLGRESIINTAASADHECILGDGVHLAPGARLGGCVIVGDRAMVGVGAVVLPRVRIGEDAIVGAGAVVLADVPPGATVVGNPAQVIRERR